MKTKMMVSAKSYLYDIVFGILISVVSLIGIYGCISAKTLLGIFLGLVLCIGILSIASGIYKIQWVTIDNGVIKVYNIFGLMKEQKMTDIRRVFYLDATVFHLKMLAIKTPCVIVSKKQSLKVCDIEDATNRKKHPYVIIPYRPENVSVLKIAYYEATGTELHIKL